ISAISNLLYATGVPLPNRWHKASGWSEGASLKQPPTRVVCRWSAKPAVQRYHAWPHQCHRAVGPMPKDCGPQPDSSPEGGSYMALREAIAAYHDLLTDERAAQTQAQLDEQLARRGLYFGQRPLTPVLRPRFFSPEQYAFLRARTRQLLAA